MFKITIENVLRSDRMNAWMSSRNVRSAAIIGIAILIGNELIPIFSDKIGPHDHPAHYVYRIESGTDMTSVGTTAALVALDSSS